MPRWVAKSAEGDAFLKYDLASPHALQYNKLDEDKTYLVWIMPKAGVVKPETTVYLGGKFDDATIQHPTPYFLTDYQQKTTVASLRNGQIRSLTAQVTQRVKLPLEYITEVNGPGNLASSDADVLALRNLMPAGQHLPTVEEASSVFPLSIGRADDALVCPWRGITYDKVDEVIEWGGHPVQTYKSEFQNTGNVSPILMGTYALRYKNSLFRSAWRYQWHDDRGGLPQLEITCRWVPLWESVTMDMIKDTGWWSSYSERNVIRRFIEDIDLATINDQNQPYGEFSYLAYWGIQKDGTPLVYGSLIMGESQAPVGTVKNMAGFFSNRPFSAFFLTTRPFYDKR